MKKRDVCILNYDSHLGESLSLCMGKSSINRTGSNLCAICPLHKVVIIPAMETLGFFLNDRVSLCPQSLSCLECHLAFLMWPSAVFLWKKVELFPGTCVSQIQPAGTNGWYHLYLPLDSLPLASPICQHWQMSYLAHGHE